ncbi:DUF2513 domain-containing protein [Thermomonas haemolytica]|uniref:Uncharacterized protein DUF2513 n=1 Tax=Thermomonas haemolytica TaxID=141949 RepID=A0A4R3N9M1_9GAMM|nr:DUF2513 domain-containing protein [Thermomonas haemolytica]TCT25915.1 uncharacterized protein DUF2513 [Thermomonas haemolytica]
MRRDWDKVRAILEALEGAGWGQRVHLDDVPGIERIEALDYFRMLVEAGLAQGEPAHSPECLTRLTWAGHDLAEVLRKHGFFAQIKDEAKRRGVALTMDAIIQLARLLVTGGA